MKRIKKAKKTESVKEFKSHFFDTKEKVIGICAAAVIILGLVIALMVVESGYGKLVVKNDTDIDLEFMELSFVNEEAVISEGIETGAVKANSTFTDEMEEVNLVYVNAQLEVRFNFAGHEELLTDVGTFSDNFDGNIKVTFTETDDSNVVAMKIKASNGIFSTRTVDCDEEFRINLAEGKIYQ